MSEQPKRGRFGSLIQGSLNLVPGQAQAAFGHLHRMWIYHIRSRLIRDFVPPRDGALGSFTECGFTTFNHV